MIDPTPVESLYGALAFALTYLVHSALFIGGTWLFLRAVQVRSQPAREALWTVALFGGVITAGLQAYAGVPSMTGTWLLPSSASLATQERSPPARVVVASAPRSSPAIGANAAVAEPVDLEGGVAPVQRSSWLWLLASVSLTISVLSLLSGVVGGLRRRREVDDPSLRASLEDLRRQAGISAPVRLTHSERVSSPVAFGLLRREICVPTRALTDLSVTQQRAMLAHELGHLVRRDPLRLLLCRMVETSFFIQPLNRLARRRLFEVVEQRCDAWAARLLGEGLSLADCLTVVAGWVSDRRSPPMAAMASRGSPLGRRVRRLLADADLERDDRRGRRLAPVLVLLVPALALAAPAVALDDSDDDSWEFERIDSEPAADDVESSGDPVHRFLAELKAELTSLKVQIAELRAIAVDHPLPDALARSLVALERRVEVVESQLATLSAWRSEMLRIGG